MPKGIKGFQKGHKSGMTGKKHTDETKKKMREIAIRNNNHPSFKGRHHSPETLLKLKKKLKGRIAWNKGINYKQIMGEKNTNWQNGIKHTNGYILVLQHEHPNADKDGYVKRCNLVMEKYIGRYLTKSEVVHHINELKDDDTIPNLQLFASEKEHQKYHYQHRSLNIKGQFLPKIS